MIVRYIAAAAVGAGVGAYLMHISKMHQPAPPVATSATPDEPSRAEQTASLILSLFESAGGPPEGLTPRPLTAGQERQ